MTTKDYKRERGLTVEQLNAIDLLVTGKSDQETADIVGVNRVTITKWRNYDFYFQAELNRKRKEIFGSSIDKLRALLPKAMERLEKEIEEEHGWKVALEIIKIGGVGDKQFQKIGHDEAEKIIEEVAEKRSTDEMFSIVNDSSKEEIIAEYNQKIKS